MFENIIQVPFAFTEFNTPLLCISNCEKQVDAHGGSIITGWRSPPKSNCQLCPFLTTLIHHAVWQSPDGELFDLTPYTDETGRSWLPLGETAGFIRDDVAVFGAVALPCRYLPLVDDDNIKKACEFLRRSDEALVSGDAAKSDYWTDRASETYARYAKPRGVNWRFDKVGWAAEKYRHALAV